MKRLVGAGVLLLLAAAVGIFALVYTDRAAEDMTRSIEELTRAETTAGRRRLADEVCEKWEDYEKILTLYSRHSEIEEITSRAAVLGAAADSPDDSQWKLRCAELSEAVRHLRETEQPKLRNIL